MPTVIRETTLQLMLAPSRITPATLRAGLLSQVRRLILLSIASLLSSGGTSNVAAASLEDLQQRVRQVLGQRSVRSAQWGIEVVDSANDRVLFALDAEQLFKPASVVKVLTTAVALEKLGPGFRFRTGVYTDGTVQPDGIIRGNLFVVGRGDPNLLDPERELDPALEGLAKRLRVMGIRRIDGDVVGDDSYFEYPSFGDGWTAEDMERSYAATISALSLYDNTFWLHAKASKNGQRVGVWMVPQNSYFRVRNLGTTGNPGSKRSLGARLIKGTQTIVISGNLPASRRGYSRLIKLEKPSEAAAWYLKDQLAREGISISGKVRTVHDGDVAPDSRRRRMLLAEHVSLPLAATLELLNKSSRNLHAELLLRTVGAEVKGLGTDLAGLQVAKEFLSDIGIEIARICLYDGSGLSRENLLSPHFQTSLLRHLMGRPYFDLFRETLAVSGTDGTLKHRLSSSSLKGTIRGKTGSLDGVASLCGYMTTHSGRELVFTIFANKTSPSTSRLRRAIDEICALFVKLY